jgi:transcription initiation factor TFIID subunit 6
MSHVRADTIEAIADGLGIAGLSREAAAALAPQVDVRLREVIQDAAKVARASKRACLIASDVDAALAARGAAPLLGHGGAGGRDAARFARAAGTADVFYAVDRVTGWDEVRKRRRKKSEAGAVGAGPTSPPFFSSRPAAPALSLSDHRRPLAQAPR